MNFNRLIYFLNPPPFCSSSHLEEGEEEEEDGWGGRDGGEGGGGSEEMREKRPSTSFSSSSSTQTTPIQALKDTTRGLYSQNNYKIFFNQKDANIKRNESVFLLLLFVKWKKTDSEN